MTFTKEEADCILTMAFHELDKHAEELDRLLSLSAEYCCPPSIQEAINHEQHMVDMLRSIESKVKTPDTEDFCFEIFDIP